MELVQLEWTFCGVSYLCQGYATTDKKVDFIMGVAGKKVCPVCDASVGVRTKVCPKPNCGHTFVMGKTKTAFDKVEFAKAVVLYAMNISGVRDYAKPDEQRPTAEELISAIKTSKRESDRLVALNEEWDVYDSVTKLSDGVRAEIDTIMKDYK